MCKWRLQDIYSFCIRPFAHSHICTFAHLHIIILMFCDIPQVNQLTSLLIAHGIRDVVVCPGSRNATIVHNLHEAGEENFTLHPVTDERSAAFVALGIALATQEPTAVCVTSGSALLGCIPAVAEAYYRHIPLLVISADRPQAWIGQMDGQTLPQNGALQPYCPTAQINPAKDEEDHWKNNYLINAALLSLRDNGGQPAHINVSIAEPMFSFTSESLPKERIIEKVCRKSPTPLPEDLLRAVAEARLPVLLLGQYEAGDIRSEVKALTENGQMLVLPEVISDVPGNHRLHAFDALDGTEEELLPDLVVQGGGNFVHKRFKSLLRKGNCQVVRIGEDYELCDTFCHLSTWVDAPLQPALAQLAARLPHHNATVKHAAKRLDALWEMEQKLMDRETLAPFTILTALQHELEALYEVPYTLHLANSSSVRAAGLVFDSGTWPIFCNRGTNGIEGSLSTAVGYALKMWGLSIVVIGDLSFFYDVNALWNTRLPSNLRILLLNDGHGAIFDRLPGLSASPAAAEFVSAGGQGYRAYGIAETFHLDYHSAESLDDLRKALPDWLSAHDDGNAQLLEVVLK